MIETCSRKLSHALRMTAVVSLLAILGACSHHKTFSQAKLLAPENTETIGVNAYLWRATLETLNFMPMADVDAKGGVVITDWYSNPSAPAERVKVTVYILSKQLRADGLKVTVFRQWYEDGAWVDVPDKDGTGAKIQDAILTEARYIRLNTIPGK